MRIEHQAPAADLSFKVVAPLRVVTPDQAVHVVEHWTLSSLEMAEGVRLPDGPVSLIVPFQGVEMQFPVTLVPSADGTQYGLQNLNGRQRELLALFYNGILSGRMASSAQMITSLDTPLDLVPMEQSEDEVASTAATAVRKTKWLGNVVFYLVMAAFLMLTVGSMIWDRLTTVPLQHARVVAPIVQHLVATPGYVTKIMVSPGDKVHQGQRLVSIGLPDQDAEVKDIRRSVVQSTRELEQLEADLKIINKTLQDEVAQAEQYFRTAIAARRTADFLGHYDMADVVAAMAHFSDVKDARTTKMRLLIDEQQDLKELIRQKAEQNQRFRRDLGIAKEMAGAGDIYATVDGIVRSVPVYRNQHIQRGHMSVEIEENRSREIHAWLPESKLGAVSLGTRVDLKVFAIDGQKTLHGQVTSLAGRRDPLINDQFGLHVVVQVDAQHLEDNRAQLVPDAPVEAVALRPIGAAIAGH